MSRAHCRPATAADRRRIRWYGFDWTVFRADGEVYKVGLPRTRSIEGTIALELRPGWVEVRLVAVAPRNRGRAGHYRIGGTLFAVACQRSFEEGYEGYVAFDAKTELVPHYASAYGAKLLRSRGVSRMMLETREARVLVDIRGTLHAP